MSAAGRRRGRRVVVVSPHFDDVPLSLGQSLLDGTLSGHRVRVEVAFSRTNWTRWVHPTPGRAALVGAWRRLEEAAAALRFGYRWRTGGLAECVLRTGELDPGSILDPDRDLSDEALVSTMHGRLSELARGDADLVLVCAGMGGHIDHRIVAAAGARLAGGGPAGEEGVGVGVPIGFYEDRPYAAYLDESERAAHLPFPAQGAACVEVSRPVTARTQGWVRRLYPSQIEAYFVDAMERDRARGATERVWFPAGTRPSWFTDAPAP